MKHLISGLIALTLLSGCDESESKPNEEEIQIITIDINGDNFPVTEVAWSYVSEPDTLFELECQRETCDVWVLPKDINGEIIISSFHTVAFENDKYCHEIYEGSDTYIINNRTSSEVTLETKYSIAVCQ